MITKREIDLLDNWAKTGEVSESTRAMHAQVVLELTQYIHYLEGQLKKFQMENAGLEERLRFMRA